MSQTNPPEKWKLTVYGLAHPRYTSDNFRWTREYAARSSANRAAAAVHRMYPGTVGELSRFVADPWPNPFAWLCRGERGIDFFELWNDKEEQPLSREILDRPDIQHKIAVAHRRIAAGDTRPGKTANDLLNLAKEQA